ncbi:site-specific DNA-methyltransferase [Bacteroidia bacterium]|nr:site-specific DNA-methyltransferase [Bacteroidia bacterium]GHT04801.1 site-specific DNA-methyltransferase [Bacteroidia bacterium]
MTKNYSDYTREQLLEEIKKLQKKKTYGLVWEDKPEQVVEDCKNNFPVLTEIPDRAIVQPVIAGNDPQSPDNTAPTNIIIEGDNYHALSVLNVTHKGKIDVIYIDPPYNTGAKDWKYNNDYVDSNDMFRHSKWLSMMNYRLTLAKNLLKENGVLICAIDENELHTVRLLLEEIFGLNYEFHCVTIVHNPRGIQGTNFSYINEFAIFVVPKGGKIIGGRKIPDNEIDWRNLRDNGGESLRTDAKNCFYPILVKDDKIIGFGDVLFDENAHPKQNEVDILNNVNQIYPIDIQGVERKWRYARQSVEKVENLLRVKRTKNRYEIEIGKNFGTYRTVWQDARYDSNEYGKKVVNSILPNCDFSFPKSLWNVYDCLYAVVENRKSATILDFFAGSGTTGHAVLELNKEDGGNRQFILCTNNENNICTEVTYPRIKTVVTGNRMDGSDYSDGIPANVRYFKTDFVPATSSVQNPSDDDKLALTAKAGTMLALKENCFEQKELNEWWQIFENSEKILAIYFKESKAKINELLAKLSDKKAVLYIFGWGKNEYAEEYSTEQVEVKDIPEPILKIYKQINGGKQQ